MMSLAYSPTRSTSRAPRGRMPALFFSLAATLTLAGPARATQPPLPQAEVVQMPQAEGTPAAPSVMTLNLAECLQLAQQRQPRIAAQRASLAAAENGKRAVDNLRLAALLVPEIPVRRRQAALGLTAAVAGVEQAERETAYAVTRTYVTVLYAREQERITRGVVDRLTATHKVAKQQLDGGARGVTDADVQRTTVYLRLAKTKHIQAAQGVKRALASLREAIGLGPDVCLDVPAGRLSAPDVRPCLNEIVSAALARRSEMIQATVFAEVTCLEVQAQGTSAHKRMDTFAAGSDIHAHSVPQGVHNNEYRPGAIGPEMPGMLAGSRAERVQHAQDLYARANAVVATTRNLLTLEAEDAFLRWEEAASQAAEALVAADTGDKLANDLSKDFTSGLRVRVDEVVTARILAAQARAQYVEFLYHEILALADLERITAGGFCAQLAEAVAPVATPAAEKASEPK